MRRAALLVVLAACQRAPAPAPVPRSPSAPASLATAAPPKRPEPEPCAPPVAKAAPFHLSIAKRIPFSALGDEPSVAPACNDLVVQTDAGLRLYDPRGGRFRSNLAPIPKFHEVAANGAIATWGRDGIALYTRESGAVTWTKPAEYGHLFPAGDVLVYEISLHAVGALRASDGEVVWTQPHREVIVELHRVGDVILVRYAGEALEALDPKTGHVLWARAKATSGDEYRQTALRGRFAIAIQQRNVTVTDAKGVDLATFPLPQGQNRIDALESDGDVVYLLTSDLASTGGLLGPAGHARLALTGYDVVAKKEVFRARMRSFPAAGVERREGSPLSPSLWVDRSAVYLHDWDAGLLAAFDRATGEELSSLGVENQHIHRLTDGFVAHDLKDGLILIERSDAESPPSEDVRIEGTFKLDRRPRGGVEIVVGSVATTTRADGRFTAKLRVRGKLPLRARQPPPNPQLRYWANAETVIVPDGRTTPYTVTLSATTELDTPM